MSENNDFTAKRLMATLVQPMDAVRVMLPAGGGRLRRFEKVLFDRNDLAVPCRPAKGSPKP